MYFKYTDEQAAIKQLAAEITNAEIIPNYREYDEEEKFPEAIMHKLSECGLVNLGIPEEYGGPGIDKIAHALIVEEISRGCASVATTLEANSLSAYPLLVGADEELKQKYLRRLTEEGKLASFALTEPGSGSDVASLTTTLQRDGEMYLLNGEKCFITNATHADFFVVLARQEVDEQKVFTAIIVDRNSAGVSIGPKEKKMGLKASDTASVTFVNVAIPLSNRIGAEGEGFKIFMKALTQARPMVGAQALGIAQGAYEAALAYAQERSQFGRPIANFQSIQFMLADMSMNIEAARLLVHKAAYLVQEGESALPHASYAKCFAADTAMKVTTDAVQIYGGYGFIRDYPVEKYMRDAKIMQIYEGTNQIQRLIIAKEIMS